MMANAFGFSEGQLHTTGATDWLADAAADPEDRGAREKIAKQATQWVKGLSAMVLSDADEFRSQAEAEASRVASHYDDIYDKARQAFVSEASRVREASNGWSNHDTWAAVATLDNDPFLYSLVHEGPHRTDPEWLKALWVSFDEEGALGINADNVNWDEVAASYADEISTTASRRTAGVDLTGIRIEDRDERLFSGVDSSGKRVTFRASEQDATDIYSIMLGDLASNFSGLTVDEGDIVSTASRRRTAAADDQWTWTVEFYSRNGGLEREVTGPDGYGSWEEAAEGARGFQQTQDSPLDEYIVLRKLDSEEVQTVYDFDPETNDLVEVDRFEPSVRMIDASSRRTASDFYDYEIGPGANLRGADLQGAEFPFATNLRGADLRGADLRETYLSRANLGDADLSSANLHAADLSDASLAGANLTLANLAEANLRSADFTHADLSSANLHAANLAWANLTGANFTGANLDGTHFTEANLTGTDLSGYNFWGANLDGANFTNTNLTGANLGGASLRGANLTNANLTNANLRDANFQRADLTGADLTGSDQYATNFTLAIGDSTTKGIKSWLTTASAQGTTASRRTAAVSSADANKVLDAIQAQYPEWWGTDGPTLVQDWEWGFTYTARSYEWAIVWEEGPYDWASLFPYGGRNSEVSMPDVSNLLPKGVWVEAITGWAVAIYPEETLTASRRTAGRKHAYEDDPYYNYDPMEPHYTYGGSAGFADVEIDECPSCEATEGFGDEVIRVCRSCDFDIEGEWQAWVDSGMPDRSAPLGRGPEPTLELSYGGARRIAGVDKAMVQQEYERLKDEGSVWLRNMVKALDSPVSHWMNTPEDEARLEAAKRVLRERKGR